MDTQSPTGMIGVRYGQTLQVLPWTYLGLSAEPERVFSSTGRMVRPDRGRLKADVIGAAACLKQWDKNEVIEWK